jgi:hypothetical protein
MASERTEGRVSANEKIEETRRALSLHKALPISRRIVRRLTSQYPSFDDRQELTKYDMPPMEKIKRMAGSWTHAADFFTVRPLYADNMEGEYQRMLQSSKRFYTSRHLAIRCNPVISKVLEAAESNRPAAVRVEEPWYAGIYRQVMPARSIFGSEPEHVGIFLTDRSGTEFEPVEIDENFITSLSPQIQRDLGNFAYDIPDRDARLVARAY